ncbi:MAG: DEAD/DEAH box helicase [Desulfobacula sp.]|nr:DEAD/DEAH box helicase [Desulfobacula sp.]
MTSITGLFHPLIKKWFLDSFSNPTDIQELAWPLMANKKNVLITAPTGSGKTPLK